MSQNLLRTPAILAGVVIGVGICPVAAPAPAAAPDENKPPPDGITALAAS
jgi:hypothetical protein